MFSSILVPLDGTAQSNAALPLARTVARATGASITLLRVVEPASMTSTREGFADASESLGRIAAELGSADLKVQSVVCAGGNPATEILRQSRAEGIDLIVMRTHGRVGISRVVLGSVTQRVLAQSSVPVMLMRPGGRRIGHIRQILVPIDGSPGGAEALGTAVALAQATGASIKIFEAAVLTPTEAYAADAYGGMISYDPAWDDDTLASAGADVDEVVARLRSAGVEADGEARQERDPARSIVTEADEANADVIVMSTQALTGPARALFGSVADAVVRNAHCPVLLVHRVDEGSREAEHVSLTTGSAGRLA